MPFDAGRRRRARACSLQGRVVCHGLRCSTDREERTRAARWPAVQRDTEGRRPRLVPGGQTQAHATPPAVGGARTQPWPRPTCVRNTPITESSTEPPQLKVRRRSPSTPLRRVEAAAAARGMGSSGAGWRAAVRGTGTASRARAPRAALGGGQAPHQPVPAAPAHSTGRPRRAGGPAGGRTHRMLCWKAATRRVQVSASLAPYTISVSCPSRMMRARLPAQAWRERG